MKAPNPEFVKEGFIAKRTLNAGSVWDIAFSTDPQQRFIFLTDGVNEKVRILLRDTLQEIMNFGDGGRQPVSSTASTASLLIRKATSTRRRRTKASARRDLCLGTLTNPVVAEAEASPTASR